MAADLLPFSVYPGGATARTGGDPPGREYQELWFSLARLQWASIVFVPADHGGTAVDAATALAEVGTRLRETPVTAMVANRIDYASARTLAELQPRLNDGGRPWPAIELEVPRLNAESVGAPGSGGPPAAHPVTPIGRAVIAIQPVVDEPLGVAVAQAADAVVLCIELGKTRLPAARRTIELIGAERIVGAVIVR